MTITFFNLLYSHSTYFFLSKMPFVRAYNLNYVWITKFEIIRNSWYMKLLVPEAHWNNSNYKIRTLLVSFRL